MYIRHTLSNTLGVGKIEIARCLRGEFPNAMIPAGIKSMQSGDKQ